MIKRFVIAILLLILIGGGLIGFNLFRDQAIQNFFANMPRPAVTVSTTIAEAVTWEPGIEAIGTASAAQGVDIAFQTGGLVREIGFAANQRVEKGKVLVQLDDTIEQADLTAAEADAALAERDLERARQLRERGVNAEVTVQTAEATAAAARARVAKAKAVLEQKNVEAPFTGTIGIPRIDVGQYVTPGTMIATLQDLDTMRADFTVPEQSLSLLRIEQPVRFGISDDDLAFQGTITGIDPKVDPKTRLVSVRARIDNPEQKLSPGQFIRVRVDLAKEEGIVALPQTAVVSSLYGDFVYVVEEKPADGGANGGAPSGNAGPGAGPSLVARQVFVEIGRRNAGRVEIVKGVEPGDQVVTAGQNRLNNGTPVTIDNTIDPTRIANR